MRPLHPSPMTREHDCQHPIEDYGPGGTAVWVCPDCGRVWEAHVDIWWAPAEGRQGGAVYLPVTPAK